MSRTEIRVTGYGGQGVVLCAYIIGRANAVNAGNHSTMIQSFGPEARGSACSATLALSDEEILYPYIKRPDIFVAMSAEGYDKFRDELKPKGTLIYEKDLVPARLKKGQKSFGVSSTRLAEGLGRTLVQNIVMLGFFAAVSKLIPHDQFREAVEGSVPRGTEELNLKAFDAGWGYFEEHYGVDAGGDATAAAEVVSPVA
jgi:2-oxoglutarate ferredoxin oxidoreductase subunit gamma